MMAFPKVTVYTQTDWLFCNYAKEFLSENNVPFIEKNITEDEAAFKELTEDLDIMTTPVFRINDETLVGFNQKKLRKLLGLKNKE